MAEHGDAARWRQGERSARWSAPPPAVLLRGSAHSRKWTRRRAMIHRSSAECPVKEMERMTPSRSALIDLHRHTDGGIRPQTILELAQQHDLPLPRDLETLRPLVQVTEPVADLMAFLARMDRAVSALADLDACARVAYECVEDASREGVVYLETRFSPAYMAQARNLDVNGVVEAVADGAWRGARDFGVRVNLIGIMSRTFGVESCTRELEALLAHRGAFIALDLAGDEARVPGELFVEHFRRGRDAGWRITVHAGEAAGAPGVWQAVHDLGAERIGHGTRAPEDPALLDMLAERRIGIESSLTRNVQTMT